MRNRTLGFSPFTLFTISLPASGEIKQAPPKLPPDERYKADILVIVAHPDDQALPAPCERLLESAVLSDYHCCQPIFF